MEKNKLKSAILALSQTEFIEIMTDYITSKGDGFKSMEYLGRVIHDLRAAISQISPYGAQPVDFVKWIPVERIQPNDYNPNSVASQEMKLLYHSIKNDGYTQPVVTIFNPDTQLYEIVDGFHRYLTMKTHPDISARTNGHLPIVVIDKDINDRMASTIRHNRARGKHAVNGMASMVFSMLDNGWGDAEICNELGMEPEELIRLKYVTGFAKLFENVEYQNAWETRKQIKLRQDYERQQREEAQRANSVEGKDS